jgi:RNA polymerase sigma factor (sigma-70 family)
MTVRLPPFQALLDEHRVEVLRFLTALVGQQDAEDCFQETFLAALRAYPKLRDASNLRAWLLTIAHRKAMDHHRSRTRRPEPVDAIPERPERHAPEEEPALWEAVRALPPRQRTAIVARYVGDLPYRDVARIAGGSEEAARRNAADGLATLREAWER